MPNTIQSETVRYDELDDVKFEQHAKPEESDNSLPELADKKSNHYVDNKALFEEFSRYHERKMKALDEGKPIPPLTDKIGEAIMQISTRRAYSWNFINYTSNWKQEMVADAIETCVKYAHNFDPEKSNNPFAYLTRIVNNAFSSRIKMEQEQTYIKYKNYDEMGGFSGQIEDNVNSGDIQTLNETSDVYRDRLEWMNRFEEKRGLNVERQKRTRKPSNTVDVSMLWMGPEFSRPPEDIEDNTDETYRDADSDE